MATHARRKAQQRSKNNKFWLWGLFALVIVGLSVVWLSPQRTTETGGNPLEISVEEAAAKRDAGAFILDVRQPEEWNEFHVPGSTLIPLGELASRIDELPRDQEIVDTLNFKPKILERKPIIERVADKIKSFIDTFVEGMGGSV